MSKPDAPLVDNPIKSSNEDILGRAAVAHDFARSIREINAEQGVVVGVMGAWGHGKSSFINLMTEEFAEQPSMPVVEFNPWLFSGAQQITDVFFNEIAAELRIKQGSKFDDIADGLNSYGDVLSPIAIIPGVGAWWDRSYKAVKSAASWWKNRRKGSRSFREEITKALLQVEQPIVIVIDDIDRLTTPEIRDIFKLVRLTASFPNVIYILAFDRKRIEQALTEDGVPGRDYLEKIIQLSFDLPSIPHELLRSQVFAALQPVLDGVLDIRFDQNAWPDVYFEIIEPLIVNLRDVTRLTLSARPTIRALGAKIEAVDLIALEAIRVFRPEIFENLHKIRVTLTEVSDIHGSRDTKCQQLEIDNLIKLAGDDADVVKMLIRRVLPAALQYTEKTHYGRNSTHAWKREHRVAHINFLDLYFGRTAPKELQIFNQSEMAFALINDVTALSDYLDSVKPEELEEVIAGLESYEEQFRPEIVTPAIIALMNRIHQIPDRPAKGMFDIMRPDLVVGRVVLRLLRVVEHEADREEIIKEVLPRLDSYSTQQDFIATVGYQDGSGHKLVSERFASQLEEDFIERVHTRTSLDPLKEWNLFRVYWLVADRKGNDYIAPKLNNPDEIRALLKSSSSTSRSQSIDSRVIREEKRLAWDPLLRILGGEERLTEAREALRAIDGESDLIKLVEKYQSGWRPERQ